MFSLKFNSPYFAVRYGLIAVTVLFFFNSACNALRPKEQKLRLKALAQNWTLETIKNKAYKPESTKYVISINFDLNQNRFSGKDGCNAYFGSIEKLTNTEMDLGKIATSKMWCPNTDMQYQFISLLNEAEKYSQEQGRLYLFDADNNILLTFIHVK